MLSEENMAETGGILPKMLRCFNATAFPTLQLKAIEALQACNLTSWPTVRDNMQSRLKQDEKSARLEREIAEVLSNVLKVSADSVKPEARLTDMGVDSLLMLELSLGLKERTGIPFTAMELLKGPNVRELAQVLFARLSGQDASTNPPQN